MWTLVVPVVHERLMGWVDPGFAGVGLMECLDLAYSGWPPHACDDMLDAVSSAELRELGDASSCRIELRTTICQDLFRFAVLADGFFQKRDGVLGGWVVMNP